MSSPDPRLSLPEERLAGSEACLNCGSPLDGPYCRWCGQPDRRLKRFFPAFLRDLLDDVLGLDSRVLRTLKPLLIRPGVLTAEFLEGRRQRFTPPLRLYLVSSVLFFLLATISDRGPVVVHPANDTSGLNINLSDEPGQSEEEKAAREGDDALPTIVIGGERWHPEKNPVRFEALPDFANAWINDELAESPEKARQVAENPRIFTDKMYEMLPASLFLLLPLAAVLLKIAYAFSGRYYVEHLIFSLHEHAFVFLTLSAATLLALIGDSLASVGMVWPGWVLAVPRAVFAAWLPLHFLMALRRVHGESWLVTLFKGGGLMMVYGGMLLVTTLVVALASFVLL